MIQLWFIFSIEEEKAGTKKGTYLAIYSTMDFPKINR